MNELLSALATVIESDPFVALVVLIVFGISIANVFEKLGTGLARRLAGAKREQLLLEGRRLEIEDRRTAALERRAVALEKIADRSVDLGNLELSRQIDALAEDEVVSELQEALQ